MIDGPTTLGTDPEFFVLARAVNKAVRFPVECPTYLPAYYALGCDDRLHYLLSHGYLEGDGLALEFTVTPTNDPKALSSRVWVNLHDARNIVCSKLPDFDVVLSAAPRVPVHPWFVQDLPVNRFPRDAANKFSLQAFGCRPDVSVYGDEAERPEASTYLYRTGGGHIHFGNIRNLIIERPMRQLFVAFLDRIIGCFSTWIDASAEARERKALYGKAGWIRCEEPSNGRLEYRTPPNAVLLTSPEMTTAVFTAAQAVANYIQQLPADNRRDYLLDLLGNVPVILECQRAINDHDSNRCLSFLRDMIQAVDHNGLSASISALLNFSQMSNESNNRVIAI